MNGKPTAAQSRFHQWCRDYGCIVTHQTNASIHHIKGSKLKLKGCDNPGEWYCIPICFYWHQDLSNPAAIHTNRKQFEIWWKTTEKNLWLDLIMAYVLEFGKTPMPEHEYQIIIDRA